MPYYFDHTATSLIEQDVIDFLAEQLKINNYNPAARYTAGLRAADSIRQSLNSIARIIGSEPEEIIITSGATESINTAIKGIVFSPNPKKKRILSSEGEHPATIQALKFVENQLGYRIDYCPLDKDGQVDLDHLQNYLLNNQYDLLTLIEVNNVVGSINPIKEIVNLRNNIQPQLPIHIDAVQSLGKIPFKFKDLQIQLASFSLHKIGGLKGMGLLVKDRATRIEPLIHGGGQQDDLRSGTENPAFVATIAFLFNKLNKKFEENNTVIAELKEYLIGQLTLANIKFEIISPQSAVPQIIALAFPDLRAETMLNVLAKENISISIGSACSSRKSEKSHVLRQMNLKNGLDEHVLRISLNQNNSKEEIQYLVKIIKNALDKYAV